MESTAVAARAVSSVHLSADQLIRRDAPQHDVRVGHRGTVAFAVTGRPGIGARALGPHAQQAAFIHARDGAAARADGVDVEHGHAHREAVDGSLQRFARLAVAKAHIGGSAAHIEAQNARETGELGDFEGADHAAGGSGEHRTDGMPPCFLGRHETAVRLHDRDRVAAGAFQLGEIFVHQRSDIGVDQRG